MLVYEIEKITKKYPRKASPANCNITLNIEEGEIFGILGDNGAGKTTLVRQMVNLLSPTSGHIRLYGKAITSDALLVPRYVGYMPQEANALNQLTVGEAIYFAAHLRGLSRKDALSERDRLVEMWQIEHLTQMYSSRLSGGENRLLRLAVATAGRLPVLILDEPTNDLAPQRRRRVWENLVMLNRDFGITIIFITHDAIEAEKVIQRLAILHLGELVVVGRPSELKKNLHQKLRLELFCTPNKQPTFPADLKCHEIQPGRWITWIDKEYVTVILQQLNLEEYDDFRIFSATLEDLYVHYTT